MKTRVIKKNGKYHPQYLIKIFRYKKWKPFTYTMSYLICTGYAENEEVEYSFNTKLEALHYIKQQNYHVYRLVQLWSDKRSSL